MNVLELTDKILLYTPVIVSFISFILMFFIPSNQLKGKLWIIIVVFCMGLSFLSPFFYFFYATHYYFIFEIILYPVALSSIVFRYFYSLSIVGKFIFSKKFLLHFIPAIFLGLANFVLFNELTAAEHFFFRNHHTEHSLLLLQEKYKLLAIVNFIIFRVIFIWQNFYYTLLIFKLTKQYKKEIANYSNYTNIIDPRWLHIHNFYTFFFRIIVSALLVISYNNIFVRFFFNSIISILVIVFVVLSIIQKKISKGTKPEIQNDYSNFSHTDDNATNISSTQSTEESLKQRLLDYFEEKKPYLNSDIKIDDLCVPLKTNRSYLSKTINSKFSMNFYYFINKYRIETAKKILLNNQSSQYTIKAVSKLSGFKSVSTFNIFFKKFEGVTPSNFRRGIKD